MLLVETCDKIRIDEGEEPRELELGDTFMGGPVQDIFRTSKEEVLGWEVHVQYDAETTETIELNPEKVVAFHRRSVTESEYLAEDLEKAPNWNPDGEEESEE